MATSVWMGREQALSQQSDRRLTVWMLCWPFQGVLVVVATDPWQRSLACHIPPRQIMTPVQLTGGQQLHV